MAEILVYSAICAKIYLSQLRVMRFQQKTYRNHQRVSLLSHLYRLMSRRGSIIKHYTIYKQSGNQRKQLITRRDYNPRPVTNRSIISYPINMRQNLSDRIEYRQLLALRV